MFKRIQGVSRSFSIGDVIPVNGDTFEYPSNFDLVDAKSGVAVLIRNSEFKAVIGLDKYSFEGYKSFSPDGLQINITSPEEFIEFRAVFESKAQEDLDEEILNKWFDVNANKKVKILNSRKLGDVEYSI
ncbi:MAG: hypothetical protein ACYDIA_25795 [Candidatus Humimicrobiaceae bacterium]